MANTLAKEVGRLPIRGETWRFLETPMALSNGERRVPYRIDAEDHDALVSSAGGPAAAMMRVLDAVAALSCPHFDAINGQCLGEMPADRGRACEHCPLGGVATHALRVTG